MDESSFDDLIKSKLTNYEDPTLDAGAFETFQEKLVVSQPIPWYDQNLSRLGMAASAIIVTLLNIYILTLYKNKNETTILTNENKKQHELVDSLTNTIHQLSSQKEIIVKGLNTKQNQLAITENENLTLKKNLALFKAKTTKNSEKELDSNQYSVITIGRASELPASVLRIFKDKQLALIDTKNDQVYLFASYRQNHILRQGQQIGNAITPIELLEVSEIKNPNFEDLRVQSPATVIKGNKKLMSLKQRNELEKHYFSGLGINVGGHLDLLQSNYSIGSGSINPRAGLVVDWIVSPRLSLETGIDYFTNSINIDRDNILDIFLPQQMDQFGPLLTAEIDNKLISSPVSIKYRQWIGEKTQYILKAGYTPYYSLSSSYFYGYPSVKPIHPNDPDDPAYSKPRINTVEQSSISGFYGGSITASIGLSRIIKKKNPLEASLFYEKSLGTVGQQGLKMDQIGVRMAYLFKVR